MKQFPKFEDIEYWDTLIIDGEEYLVGSFVDRVNRCVWLWGGQFLHKPKCHGYDVIVDNSETTVLVKKGEKK